MEAEPHVAVTTEGTMASARPTDRAEGFGGAVTHGNNAHLGRQGWASRLQTE